MTILIIWSGFNYYPAGQVIASLDKAQPNYLSAAASNKRQIQWTRAQSNPSTYRNIGLMETLKLIRIRFIALSSYSNEKCAGRPIVNGWRCPQARRHGGTFRGRAPPNECLCPQTKIVPPPREDCAPKKLTGWGYWSANRGLRLPNWGLPPAFS